MLFRITKFKLLISLYILLMTPVAASASNIFVGDNYFLQKQYDLATKEYLAVAEVGNPRAYYQLGVIHYQGLGTETDGLKALIWFSLAAEHYYENSVEIVEQLLAQVPEEQQQRAITLVNSFRESFGKKIVDSKYYPELLVHNLKQKIHFGDQKDDQDIEAFIEDEFDMDLPFDEAFEQDSFDDSFDEDEEDSGLNFQDTSAQTSSNSLLNGPYFLIADYDIAPDGSIRNISPVQTMGYPKKGLDNLSTNTLPIPKFVGQGVHFVNRSYLGMASFDKFRMRNEHPYLYNRIRRMVRKLAKSDLPKDVYQQAMMLMNFPWLTQEAGDVDKLLKSAAEQGYALAKYEYGLKLYREQNDLKQAIYWISAATKQGNSQAMYRLARIFLDSPWVVSDEKKALFWLEQATEQDHLHAKLKLAEIKLLAKDEKLHDVTAALVYLNELTQEQESNPKYHYLQAMAHVKMQPRQLSKAVSFIREAIDMGEDYNWDVAPWQQQLKKWTSGGRVTIQEL